MIFIKHKVILATIILFALITLSCISAADNNATDDIVAQDTDVNANEIVAQNKDINTYDTLTNGENEVSDFTTLNTEIANSTTNTIQLTKNYTYNKDND